MFLPTPTHYTASHSILFPLCAPSAVPAPNNQQSRTVFSSNILKGRYVITYKLTLFPACIKCTGALYIFSWHLYMRLCPLWKNDRGANDRKEKVQFVQVAAYWANNKELFGRCQLWSRIWNCLAHHHNIPRQVINSGLLFNTQLKFLNIVEQVNETF